MVTSSDCVKTHERGLEGRGLRMFESKVGCLEEPHRDEWRGWEIRDSSYFRSG